MAKSDYVSTPFIGTEVTVSLAKQLDPESYRLDSIPQFPTSWEGRFRVRDDSAEYRVGDQVDAWLFRVHTNDQQVWFTADDFGRYPASESMCPRYVGATQHVRWLCDQTTLPQLGEIDEEHVSDFKGIINRCRRKDQRDWCTLYMALGRPPRSELDTVSGAIGALSSALRNQDREQVEGQLRGIKRTSIPNRLPAFICALRDGTETYADVAPVKLKNAIQHMDGTPFEDLVSDCWQHLGWTTKRTPQSHDEGIDVIATREGSYPQKIVIQAKCYIERNSVTSTEVEDLAEDRYNEPDVDKAYLVTSGGFTGNAWNKAAEKGITLINGDSLLALIDQENLYPVVDQYLIDAW